MKTFARFSRWGERYDCEKANSREMQILGMFLISEVGCPPNTTFMEVGVNPKIRGIEGQAASIEIVGDVAEMRDVWEDEETGPVFRIPKDQYLKMMGLWKDLYKVKPKEITVTWDGKEITVEGKN